MGIYGQMCPDIYLGIRRLRLNANYERRRSFLIIIATHDLPYRTTCLKGGQIGN